MCTASSTMAKLAVILGCVFTLLAPSVVCDVLQLPLSLYKQKYWLTIQVGTPTQPANVVLDTGSKLLYIPQEECYWADGKQCRPPRFNPDASSTFVNTKKSSTASYTGGYSVNWRSFEDYLQVGSVKAKGPMGLVTSYTVNSELDPPYSGLWGLAPGAPAIRALLDKLDSPIISLYFKPDPNTASSSAVVPEGAGFLTLGGWDNRFAEGPLQWIPVTSADASSWTVWLSGVQLGSEKLDMCDGKCPFLHDSGGASVLSMPDAHRDAIRQALGADTAGKVPCDSISSLPDLTFTLAGTVKISLPSSIYTTEDCGLRILGGTEKYWVGGYAFMRYYYHAFDYGRSPPLIGIAKAAASG